MAPPWASADWALLAGVVPARRGRPWRGGEQTSGRGVGAWGRGLGRGAAGGVGRAGTRRRAGARPPPGARPE